MKAKKLISVLLVSSVFMFSCGGGGGDSSSSGNKNIQVSSAYVSGNVYDGNNSNNVQAQSVWFLKKLEISNNQNAIAKLILDTNKDGLFEENKDKTYKAVVSNGNFTLRNIQFEGNQVDAKLIIEKGGYLPFSKVFTLKDKDVKNINAQIKQVTLKTARINSLSSQSNNYNITTKKVSKISPQSLKEGNIEIAVNINNLENINLNDMVKVAIKDVSLESEGKYIPVSFEGLDINGNTISFKAYKIFFIDITKESGEPLKAKENTKDTFIINVSNLNVSDGKYPIFGFGEKTETWQQIGSINISGNKAEVKLDQLDYNWFVIGETIENQQYKNLQLTITAQDATTQNPISDIYIYGFNNTTGTFVYGETDNQGKATINLIVDKNATCDDTGYSLYFYDIYNKKEVKIPSLKSVNNVECEYTINLNSPFNATVTIYVGQPNKLVCVEDEDGFMDCKESDSEGKATFKLKDGEDYTAFSIGIGKKDFTAIDRRTIKLATQQKQPKNNPPHIVVYAYPEQVKAGQSVYVTVNASDYDFDKLTLTEYSCGNENAQKIEYDKYEENGYAYVDFECVYNKPGNYTIFAKVSDGKGEEQYQTSVKVIEKFENRPPQYYGFDVFEKDENGNEFYTSPTQLIVGKTYNIYLYTYDPDGDNIQISLNDTSECNMSEDNTYIECIFNEAGDKNITATISDGNGGEKNVNLHLKIKSAEEAQKPKVDYFYAKPKGENAIALHVYIISQEELSSVKIGDLSGKCNNLGKYSDSENYYECTFNKITQDKANSLVQDGKITLKINDKYEESISVDNIDAILGLDYKEPSFSQNDLVNFIANAHCFQRDDDVTCQITSFDAQTGSFTFKCENGNTDTPKIISENGILYIQEGNGSRDEVVYLDENQICLYLKHEGYTECLTKTNECPNFDNEGGYTEELPEYQWTYGSWKYVYDFFKSAGKIWGYDRILFECGITVIDKNTIKFDCRNLDTKEKTNSRPMDFDFNQKTDLFIGDGFICFGIKGPSDKLLEEPSRCLFNENIIPPTPLYKQGQQAIKQALVGKIFGGPDGALKLLSDGNGVYCDRNGLEQGDFQFNYKLECEEYNCVIHIIIPDEEDTYIRPLYVNDKAFVFEEYKYPNDDTTQEFKWKNDALQVLNECPPKTNSIKDYSNVVTGTINGIQIDGYTKVRIVPDINW